MSLVRAQFGEPKELTRKCEFFFYAPEWARTSDISLTVIVRMANRLWKGYRADNFLNSASCSAKLEVFPRLNAQYRCAVCTSHWIEPSSGSQKRPSRKTWSFLSIAKAMVYHHALACISSPKVYIISRRLYFAFAMMIYKAFRFDDMQFLAELMIYTPLAWFVKLHFCTTWPTKWLCFRM